MTPVLYGEIRVILRENEVKTFRWRVSRKGEREREWKGSRAKITRGREEGGGREGEVAYYGTIAE